ncbi:hypothetical protein DFS33DRAFT_1387126 [Desarmillaria ectypa]|nr:hypothetical protein DFS33DRAFT_1387126 [Desarmillaria ectypa]
MFFHFIKDLFLAGWSPNEVVSTPHTSIQKRFNQGDDRNHTDYPYANSSPGNPSSDHASVVRRAVIGSVVGGVGLISILLLGFLFLRRRRRRRLAATKGRGGLEEEKDVAVVHRDSGGTSTQEHFVVVGKNTVRLDPPPALADEGPSARNIRHEDPPPAYH